MNVKVTRRNVKMTASAVAEYNDSVIRRTVNRAHVPNLRFGTIAFATDADVDG
jgi:DNA gyrase/topoisomerase IV subunit B